MGRLVKALNGKEAVLADWLRLALDGREEVYWKIG